MAVITVETGRGMGYSLGDRSRIEILQITRSCVVIGALEAIECDGTIAAAVRYIW